MDVFYVKFVELSFLCDFLWLPGVFCKFYKLENKSRPAVNSKPAANVSNMSPGSVVLNTTSLCYLVIVQPGAN